MQEIYVSMLFLLIVFHMTEFYKKLNEEMITTLKNSPNGTTLARFGKLLNVGTYVLLKVEMIFHL